MVARPVAYIAIFLVKETKNKRKKAKIFTYIFPLIAEENRRVHLNLSYFMLTHKNSRQFSSSSHSSMPRLGCRYSILEQKFKFQAPKLVDFLTFLDNQRTHFIFYSKTLIFIYIYIYTIYLYSCTNFLVFHNSPK